MLTRLAIAAALAAAHFRFALAHEAMFGPGTFTRDNNPWELAYPLDGNSGGVDKWFFRGLRPESAKGAPVQLKAGGKTTVHIGCDPGAADRSGTCPEDFGSLHSGDGSRTGCAIAISYKPFDQIKPEDMKVVSVLADCVGAQSAHTFAIPANLPATPKGKSATCAWTWIPSERFSADEMYMTGFNCEVQSSTPAGSLISNAKTMLFWGIKGLQLPSSRPLYNNLFKNGAQQFDVKSSGASAKVASSSSKSADKAVVKAKAKSAVKVAAPAKKCRSKARRSIDLSSPPVHARRSSNPERVPVVARGAALPHRRAKPIR